jgi:hypothetical protein
VLLLQGRGSWQRGRQAGQCHFLIAQTLAFAALAPHRSRWMSAPPWRIPRQIGRLLTFGPIYPGKSLHVLITATLTSAPVSWTWGGESKLPGHIGKGRAGRRTRVRRFRQRCRVASPPPVPGEPSASSALGPGEPAVPAGRVSVTRQAAPGHCHVAVAQAFGLPPGLGGHRTRRMFAPLEGTQPRQTANPESAWRPIRADRNGPGNHRRRARGNRQANHPQKGIIQFPADRAKVPPASHLFETTYRFTPFLAFCR